MKPVPIPDDATSVTIDPAQILGPVKYMNAVNNGPKKAPPSQRSENFTAYRAARIPFARIHDANYSSAYGAPHTAHRRRLGRLPGFRRRRRRSPVLRLRSDGRLPPDYRGG